MKKLFILFFIGIIMSCDNMEIGKNTFPQVSHLVYYEDGLHGIKNLDETIAAKPTFKNVPTMVFDGMFFVIPNDETEYALYNVKNLSKPVAKGFSSVLPFTANTTLVTKKKRSEVYLIDKSGKELKKLNLPDIVSLNFISEGASVAKDMYGKKRILSMENFSLSHHSFDECTNFSNGIALAVKGKDINYVNKEGEIITNYAHNSDKTFLGDETIFTPEWLPFIEDKTKTMGVKDIKGNIVVESGKYQEINFIYEGYSVAHDKKQYYLINSTGNEVFTSKTPIKYAGNGILFVCHDKHRKWESKWDIRTLENECLSTTQYLEFRPYMGYTCSIPSSLPDKKIYGSNICQDHQHTMDVCIQIPHKTDIELLDGIFVDDNLELLKVNGLAGDRGYEEEAFNRKWKWIIYRDSVLGMSCKEIYPIVHDNNRIEALRVFLNGADNFRWEENDYTAYVSSVRAVLNKFAKKISKTDKDGTEIWETDKLQYKFYLIKKYDEIELFDKKHTIQLYFFYLDIEPKR